MEKFCISKKNLSGKTYFVGIFIFPSDFKLSKSELDTFDIYGGVQFYGILTKSDCISLGIPETLVGKLAFSFDTQMNSFEIWDSIKMSKELDQIESEIRKYINK